MRLFAVEVNAFRHPGVQSGVEVRVDVPGRWVRLVANVGVPPGSHIGLWRTAADDLRGINLRLGRRYVGPCLTLLAHTRPNGRRS
jgi:hypothetical protein